MKEVKTKQSGNAPRVLSDAARAPKELARRSMIQAKEKAQNATQRSDAQQDDSPDRYAENRVEQVSEDVAYRTVEGGKNAVRNANDVRKQVNEIRKERNTYRKEQSNHQTNSYRAGRERTVRNTQRRAVQQNVQQTE